MEELEELRTRVEQLEKRNAYLEETLSAANDIERSEEARRFIESRRYAMTVAGLVNSVAGFQQIDLSAEERVLKKYEGEKALIDARIEEAVASTTLLVGTDEELSMLFDYVEVEGGIEITSYNGFNMECIVVPETIGNNPVVGIGVGAFRGLEVERVVLPSGIRGIEKDAFFECKKLHSVELSQELKSIGIRAFASTALRSIDIPSGMTMLSGSCFMNCADLRGVAIPGSVSYVGRSAFEFCLSLTDVTIGEGVRYISERAFFNCPVSSVALPESLYYIGKDAFGIDEMTSMLERQSIHVAVLGDGIDFAAYCDEDNCESYSVEHCEGEDGPLFPREPACIDRAINNVALTLRDDIIIYCKPGAAIQKPARRCGAEVKPLNLFKSQTEGFVEPTASIGDSVIHNDNKPDGQMSSPKIAHSSPQIIYKDDKYTVTGFSIESVGPSFHPGIVCVFENNTDEFLDDFDIDAEFFDSKGRKIGQSFCSVDFVAPRSKADLDFSPLPLDLSDETVWTLEMVKEVHTIKLSPLLFY